MKINCEREMPPNMFRNYDTSLHSLIVTGQDNAEHNLKDILLKCSLLCNRCFKLKHIYLKCIKHNVLPGEIYVFDLICNRV